ncbi:MAG: cyclic nucleotide-binding domain-containing protein [Phycisphaerales bacterium]
MFWTYVQTASTFPVPLWQVCAVFLLVALGLSARFPARRRRLAGSVGLMLVGIAGLCCAATFRAWSWEEHDPAYRWTQFAAVLVIYAAIINVAAIVLFDAVLGFFRLRPPAILGDLLVAAMYVVAALSLLSQAGVSVMGVITTSAIVTAVIGFAFQDTLGNVIGGLALQLEGSVREGDWVRVGDVEGRVREIHWRHTSIETRNFDTVVVPNGVLMKTQVTLLGRRTGRTVDRRQIVPFFADFRASPTTVIAAAEAALRADPIVGVATDPAPNVVLMAFRDSLAEYHARYHLTDLAINDPTDSRVRIKILAALRRADIASPLPAQALFLTTDSTARRERKRSAERERRIAILRSLSLLAPLAEDEVAGLAERLRRVEFARGEVITRQGAEAHWLYILAAGRAEAFLATEDGLATRRVATLVPGEFFGELSLLTGARRTATIIAAEDTLCYRLEKDAFVSIIHTRPEIAEPLGRILADRKAEREALIEGLNAAAEKARADRARPDLAAAIRRFFLVEG